jgi:hypothetical protein
MSTDTNTPEPAKDLSEPTKAWLQRTILEAKVLAEAYRLRLVGILWWANLGLIGVPAAFGTAAAAFAVAANGAADGKGWAALVAACLAGIAAFLTAFHKAFKCDEYQAECLRLSQAYRSIAIQADSILSNGSSDLEDFASKLTALTESGKAPLPSSYIRKAEELTGYKLYNQVKSNVGTAVDARRGG